MQIRVATEADLPALHPVIERAYRGDSARAGWTFEADLLSDDRTDLGELTAIVCSASDRLLVAISEDGVPIGCVQVTSKGAGLAYLGLLCIDPVLQVGGLGRQLIAAAEDLARDVFGAHAMEMTVIDQRVELIAYYERRGYGRTGEKRPFPVLVDPPLAMVVLEKALA